MRHLVYFVLGFQENSMQKAVCFLVILVIKGILKALFSFISWLLNFSELPNYGSNSRKRYTLRLLSKCLVRSSLLPTGGKIQVAHQSAHFQAFALKFAKFVLSFLKPRASFSSSFPSLTSVLRDNSSVLFI